MIVKNTPKDSNIATVTHYKRANNQHLQDGYVLLLLPYTRLQ